MRDEAESHGPIRYVVNTEHHVDHIFGNYFFKGAGHGHPPPGRGRQLHGADAPARPVRLRRRGDPDDDPDGAAIFPARDVYFEDPNRAQIVFTGDVTLHVGDHTFNLLQTPGHTPGQIAVHVPEERVVFTGDTVFSEVQTWVMASDVDEWIEALNTISRLDVDHVVPGHGPVTDLATCRRRRQCCSSGSRASPRRCAKGWSREETIERVHMRDRYPVDIGQEYMMDYIQKHNAGILWDKLSAPFK